MAIKQFDAKTFNPDVFATYSNTVPDLNLNALLQSGAVVGDGRLVGLFGPQVGSYRGTLPIFGRIDGAADNYDGATDINRTSLDTYSQDFIVIGRAKGFEERDFSFDITGGVNFMSKVAEQIAKYWQNLYQNRLLDVLSAVFSMTGAANVKFVNAHTYNISNKATGNGVSATTLNNAVQKAFGDHKQGARAIVMHSKIATDLENISVLEYMKYNDANGIQRNLSLATWNGKLVLIDDNMPMAEGYYDAVSGQEGALKIVASGAGAGEINLADVEPYFGEKTLAADMYVVKGEQYVSYILGDGAIVFQDVQAKQPYEMWRNPSKNGGVDELYSRKRFIIAPKAISFVGTTASNSPTDAELKNGANWSIVDNGQTGAAKKVYPHKAIYLARLITR